MCECHIFCLLMAIQIALNSSSALIAPTSDVNAICKTTKEKLITHPTNCAQYYDCAYPGITVKAYLVQKHLQECPAPQLYNPDTQRCEHFSLDKCGNRTERCMYTYPLGGMPCYYYNPSCSNLPDGLNVYKGRENTPYYIVCVNHQRVYIGHCPNTGKGTPFFDGNYRICSSH